MQKVSSRPIRIGVGGWIYAPWRGVFYPAGLPHKRELEYASRKLTSIEIDSTFYRSQKPDSFARWHDETPGDFMFSLKGPRFVTNRRVLAEAGPSIERFFGTGVLRLGDKLGPINWQFMPTKKFDPDDFARFLALLPNSMDGKTIRHAVEVRHPSFRVPEFVALARAHQVAIVIAGDAKYPQIADPTAPFVYARIMGTQEAIEAGYAPDAVATWTHRAEAWAKGQVVDGLATVEKQTKAPPREVFLYVISGFKQRNPIAAMTLIGRLGGATPVRGVKPRAAVAAVSAR